jgi:hypothetical protein
MVYGHMPCQPTIAAQLLGNGGKIEPYTIIIMGGWVGGGGGGGGLHSPLLYHMYERNLYFLDEQQLLPTYHHYIYQTWKLDYYIPTLCHAPHCIIT